MANGNGANGTPSVAGQVSIVQTPWGALPTKLIEFFVKDAPMVMFCGVLAWFLYTQGQDAKADRSAWYAELAAMREVIAQQNTEAALQRMEFQQLSTFLRYRVSYQPEE